MPSSLTENSDDNKRAEDLSKESNDLGIEVMEYINAAGIWMLLKTGSENRVILC